MSRRLSLISGILLCLLIALLITTVVNYDKELRHTTPASIQAEDDNTIPVCNKVTVSKIVDDVETEEIEVCAIVASVVTEE